MVFSKDFQNKSGLSESNKTNQIAMNVVIDDGAFQGTSDITQVKQEQSELDSIIMEGDIILKVHADGEIDYSSQKDFTTVLSGECADHGNLLEYQDDYLVKLGDTFETNRDFVNYVNSNASRWCFSYKCTEAKDPDTENEAYTYCCVYLKNRDYTKKKGVKKRYNCKTDCPCKVKLRRKPGEDLTVEYVCNHHDHDISEEDFQRFQSNRKLPPYIKEIIMDLLALEVEVSKISKFIEMETGMKLNRSYFHEIERKMRLKNEERQITDKRLKELSEKMSLVDEMYSGDDDDDNSDNQSHGSKVKRIKMSGPDGIVCKFEDEETIKKTDVSLKSDNKSSFWENNQSANRTSTSEWNETTMTAATDNTNMEDDTGADEYSHEYAVEEMTQETSNTDNNTENTFPQYETVVLQDEFGNIINCENDEQIVILQQDENGMVQDENGTIGYFDGEQIIYMSEENQQGEQTEQQVESNEGNESSNACDSVQTNYNVKAGHSFVPVFDIHMKNGNVTGYVVNNNVAKENPEGKSPRKEVRELHIPIANTSHSETEAATESIRNISASNATQEFISGDIYTKHEYIHRYNIDHYMANPQFPKYIDTLAKKTRVDVIQMLARVYNEKAMFKMTTTQKGKEGNTKIWYLTDVRRKGKYKMSDEEKMKRDKIGQYLTDILILKERCKHLKRENEELITRNKYLEEVALRLAKMQEHN